MIYRLNSVLEALQDSGEPALLTLQIHPTCGTQHDEYLERLTLLLGTGDQEQHGEHRWVRWPGEIVLYEPI